MRRVTFALPSLDHGGAQKVFLELAEYYCHQGYAVDLLLLNKVGSLVGRVPEQVNVVDFSMRGNRFLVLIRQLFLVDRWVSREGVGCVLSTVTGMNLFVIVSLFFSSKVKVVIREANSLENVSRGVVLLLMRCLYWRADKVICTSQYCLEQLQSRNFCKLEKLVFLPNPISVEEVLAKSRAPITLTNKNDVYRLVCVSRLVIQKAVDVLIDAVAIMSKKITCELLVIGDGPELERLKIRVQEHDLQGVVTFVGYQVNPYPLMATADLFVLPSRWEGYVNTIIEAMILKLPIVATDCKSGPTDLMRDKLGHSLVPVDDPIALSEAIEIILLSDARPDYSAIVQLHSIDVAGQAYLRLLSE